MRTAEAVIFDGDVLQHPTTPVIKLTNMKKKATMKSAIIERPMSAIKEIMITFNDDNFSYGNSSVANRNIFYMKKVWQTRLHSLKEHQAAILYVKVLVKIGGESFCLQGAVLF